MTSEKFKNLGHITCFIVKDGEMVEYDLGTHWIRHDQAGLIFLDEDGEPYISVVPQDELLD